jgi:hypothetical protein
MGTIAGERRRMVRDWWMKQGSAFTRLAMLGALGMICGALGAAVTFEIYMKKRIRQRIERVHIYPTHETKVLGPGASEAFDVNCKSGDLPMTFTFATANLNLSQASPQLRGATPNQRNGFNVLIFNGADQHNAPQPITVTTICLSRG